MTKFKMTAIAIATVVAAILIGFSISRRTVAEIPAAPAPAPDASGIVPFRMEQQWLIKLKLAKAGAATLARQITSTGRVVPAHRNRAIVAPPVGGVITEGPLPRMGQQVVKGQLMARLGQTPTAAEAAQMRIESARLEAERRRLIQAQTESQVRLNLAKSEFERAERLYRRKAFSLKQLQIAEADYEVAQASVVGIEEQLKALNLPVSAGAYEVRAPVSGTVVRVDKAAGEQVNPGEAILEIVNLDTVWVEAPIFERDLGRLRDNLEAAFTTAAFPDTEFRGILIDIGAVIDEQTRAATVLFEVRNSSKMLRIGMQANVRLDADEQVKAVLIPKEAVLENEGKKIVYVLLSGETFKRLEVEVGDEHGNKIAILSGLEAGQRVVTQGAYQLKLQELRPADTGAHTHET